MLVALPLPAVVAGVVAILLLFGAVVLLEMLARAIDNMLGANWLQRGLSRVWMSAQQALNTVAGWFDGMIAVLFNLILAIPSAIEGLGNIVADVFEKITSTIRYVRDTLIPRLINDVYSWVMQLTDYVRAWVSGLVNDIYRWIENRVNAIYATISGWVNGVYRWTMALADGIKAWISGLINDVYRWTMALADGIKAWISGLINNVYGWVVNQLAGLQRWITTAIGAAIAQAINTAIEWSKRFTEQAIGALESALAIAAALPLAPAWPRVWDALDAIAKTFPGSLADLLNRIGAIPRALPRGLAGILAAVGVIAAVGVDWIKECGVPLCKRLGGFGREIEALQDAEMIIALLDIASDIIHDPRGAGNDAATVFSTLVSDAASGLLDSVRQ